MESQVFGINENKIRSRGTGGQFIKWLWSGGGGGGDGGSGGGGGGGDDDNGNGNVTD